MRELSGEQRTEREWDPGVNAGDASQARVAWLRYVLAALGIAALGLLVAASLGVTTRAQTVESGLTALPMTSSAAVVAPEKKQTTDKEAMAELLAKGFLRGVIFTTEDVDATFERIRASGADVLQEPIDQPYGVRDCAFRDPSGNMLRFNQSAKG